MEYFSEREGHVVPRETEEINDVVRDGIGALIRSRIADGSFGLSFPENCPDIERKSTIGTDEESFRQSMRALIPGLTGWPWASDFGWSSPYKAPDTLQILDAIEFCWEHIAEPNKGRFHDYFGHSHLHFDQLSGRVTFRNAIEALFRRNGVAYKLTVSGRIERILTPEFDATVTRAKFRTGDDELDRLLSTARSKFLEPDIEKRREALEALWDAWERLKTVGPGSDKKAQVKAMLDTAAGNNSPKFREVLEKEALELTAVGNSLRIRHSETTQEKLATSEHVDHVFQRMFSLIWMILRTQKMVGA